MNLIYKEYRKWLDGIEANIRINFPGWNVELREHRKGIFALYFGNPLASQCDRTFYLNMEQVEFLETARELDLAKFFEDGTFCRHPLGA